ncbi:TolC family protein [Mangrovivirga sp. M17]|uniref:TolC family protein n=1 Tax=Mangrovivirga halotolerans TaxID=2993936 RepID=A0ABT3RQ42_9BACT|nr:TolC family protein [Mangrovivirga halotolerans]MCX2743909.1 TolC family protein [Mangrovivirga halotolerans]
MKTKYITIQKGAVSLLLLVLTCITTYSQTFDEYYKIALENNPEVKAKYYQFEAALERVDKVNSLPDPTLSFGYFISPVETRVGPQRAKFSLSQMFPWFGTLKAKGDAAAIAADAQFLEFQNAKSLLYQKLAGYYYPLYELDKKITLLEENISLLKSYKKIAQIKFENGKVPLVDVLRTDLLINKSETEIEILRNQEEPLRAGFNSVMDWPVDTIFQIADTVTISEDEIKIISDSTFYNHSKIKSLEMQAAASEAEIEAIEAQSKPGFGIGLDYVIVDKARMPVEDSGKDVIMPMVSISLPIFGGKYRAAKNEARAMSNSYKEMRLQAINDFQSAYYMSKFELAKVKDKLDLYQKQISHLKQMLSLQYRSYANNSEDFEELLRMQQELLEYQILQLEVIKEYKIAEAELDYYLGNNLDTATE